MISTITNRGSLSFMVFTKGSTIDVIIRFVCRTTRPLKTKVFLVKYRQPGQGFEFFDSAIVNSKRAPPQPQDCLESLPETSIIVANRASITFEIRDDRWCQA